MCTGLVYMYSKPSPFSFAYSLWPLLWPVSSFAASGFTYLWFKITGHSVLQCNFTILLGYYSVNEAFSPSLVLCVWEPSPHKEIFLNTFNDLLFVVLPFAGVFRNITSANDKGLLHVCINEKNVFVSVCISKKNGCLQYCLGIFFSLCRFKETVFCVPCKMLRQPGYPVVKWKC